MLILVLMVSTVKSATDDIYRLHYGTVLQSQGRLEIFNSVWRHTTRIKLIKAPEWIPIRNCKDELKETDVNLYKAMTCCPDVEITREFNAIRHLIVHEIQMTVEEIH